MKVFLTGGTGFIGERVARRLWERGDDVAALVRDPERAAALRAMGADLVAGDLGDAGTLEAGMAGCDALVHGAAVYRVGIPPSERPAMFEANVHGTQRVLDAAAAAGVPRIVYVSTVNAFGNTRGKVVDETYVRPEGAPFVSYYDETKYLAHQEVMARIARGAPIVVAQPGAVYGPGDHSQVGSIVEQVRTGRLRVRTFPRLGMNLVHVEDAAAGIVLVLDRGRVGESYVLGGQVTTMGDVIDTVARLSGRPAPRLTLPSWAVRASIPLSPIVTRMMELPPNLRELISAADGVTYWATDAKARRELGYAPRDLEIGMRDTLAVAAA